MKGLKLISALRMALQSGLKLALQVVDMRLALVIGLLMFVITVSFDAAGNSAEAADFANRAGSKLGLLPVTVVHEGSRVAQSSSNQPLDIPAAVSGEAQTSQPSQSGDGLHHGMITSASIVDDRVTAARLRSGQRFN